MTLTTLIPTVQISTGPVILISGVGLLLLSITNRLGRVIDRARILTKEYHASRDSDSARILGQLRILSRRARLLRSSIVFASLSLLMASCLIISLFLGALFSLSIAGVVASLFVSCLGSVVVSILYFLTDLNLALQALWLELPSEVTNNPGSTKS